MSQESLLPAGVLEEGSDDQPCPLCFVCTVLWPPPGVSFTGCELLE